MSGLFQHPQMVEVLGWPLLHFIWQGSLIASLVALGNALLRNARPHSRYLLACMGMVLCLLWPAIDIWLQWKSPATMSLQTALALIESGLAQVDLVFVDESQLAAILQIYLAPLVACWTIGVSIMLCRMALGLLWVRALGQGIADAEQKQLTVQWQLRTDAMRSRLGIRRQVRLLTDTQLRSPVTAGFWLPVIVMPAALLTGLPPHLIDALLAHELAHIKRWDYLVNLVQNLVLSLLFYHPAVWWIARRMDIEREQIADDIASSALTQARDLALALQKLDRLQLSTAMLAQAADGGHLLARIKRLIRPDQQPWRWRMAAPVLGAILAAIAVAAYQRQSSEQAAHMSEQLEAAGRHAALQPAVLTKPHVTAMIKTHSQHVLVVDEDSGRILLQKDADARVPIASLSKLMTAMVTLDAHLDMREKFTVAQQDVPDGDRRKDQVPVGTTLSRNTLLQLMLIPSDNRAARALARTYPGGEAAFLAAVQKKIQTLGLKQTFMDEASGFSGNNVSSASDIARLTVAAATYPLISQITTTRESHFHFGRQDIVHHNTNTLLGTPDWQVLLSKTGLSREAGRCLTMRLKMAGKTVTMVLLNAPNLDFRNEDVQRIRHMLEQTGMPTRQPLPALALN